MGFLPNWPLEPNTLAVFGIPLAAGAIGGFLAHKWPWLPSITGFMLVGLITGPSGLNVLTAQVLSDAHVLVDIALGLVLFRLGLSLDLRVIARGPYLLVTSLPGPVRGAATEAPAFRSLPQCRNPLRNSFCRRSV